MRDPGPWHLQVSLISCWNRPAAGPRPGGLQEGGGMRVSLPIRVAQIRIYSNRTLRDPLRLDRRRRPPFPAPVNEPSRRSTLPCRRRPLGRHRLVAARAARALIYDQRLPLRRLGRRGFFLPSRQGRRRGSKPESHMNNNGARTTKGGPGEGPNPLEKRARAAQTPTHDLLVMSHGPDEGDAGRSNHACLNSFRSSSWIMEAGGRPKTMVGL